MYVLRTYAATYCSSQVRSMHDALLMLLKSPVDAVRRAAGEGLALLATNMGTVYQVLGRECGVVRCGE